jgi:hypothetical protein
MLPRRILARRLKTKLPKQIDLEQTNSPPTKLPPTHE